MITQTTEDVERRTSVLVEGAILTGRANMEILEVVEILSRGEAALDRAKTLLANKKIDFYRVESSYVVMLKHKNSDAVAIAAQAIIKAARQNKFQQRNLNPRRLQG